MSEFDLMYENPKAFVSKFVKINPEYEIFQEEDEVEGSYLYLRFALEENEGLSRALFELLSSYAEEDEELEGVLSSVTPEELTIHSYLSFGGEVDDELDETILLDIEELGEMELVLEADLLVELSKVLDRVVKKAHGKDSAALLHQVKREKGL